MENKTVKLTNSKQEVKPLDVTVKIINGELHANVEVELIDPTTHDKLYSEGFKMIPNVPLESYVQYTFGMYNAFCKDQTENA